MHQQLIDNVALQGRIAVVTGAGSGIGQETACVFAQAGALVVLADVDEAGLARTAAMVEALSGEGITHVTDVSQRAEVDGLADMASRQRGRLNIWINAAGILTSFSILDAQEAEIDRLLATNLKGQYWGCAAAGRAMKPLGGGSIVNISSAAADNPTADLSAYAISKAGVNMLTRSAAVEFGAFHCRVNAIAPGFIETPMVASAYLDSDGNVDPARRDEFLHARASATPLGITGRPRDVALAALYLASDLSRFVTGQVLRVNGGLVMA
jgi:3-oxoacyl-[acyl-carrier protein] reductase